MLRDRAFEAGFVFLTPADLSLFDHLTEDAPDAVHARTG